MRSIYDPNTYKIRSPLFSSNRRAELEKVQKDKLALGFEVDIEDSTDAVDVRGGYSDEVQMALRGLLKKNQ